MPMYIPLEYSENYSMTSGSLWNYYIERRFMMLIMLQMANDLNIKQK